MTEVCKMTKKLDGIAYDIVRDHFHYYDAGMHDLACKITAALEQAQAAERTPQPCGHPMACVVSAPCPECGGSGYISDGRGGGEPCGCNADVASYCGWCASINVEREAERAASQRQAVNLTAALGEAIKAIESLPEDALGMANEGDRYQWPIRNELLARLDTIRLRWGETIAAIRASDGEAENANND